MHKFNKYIGACLLAVVAGSAVAVKGGCNKPDGSAYYTTTLAIAGHGARGGQDDGAEDDRADHTNFEHCYSASTGDELLARLSTVCSASGTITKLNIYCHGYDYGLVFLNNKGFYYDNFSFALTEAASASDLQTKINDNTIRFCNPVIKIQACNVAVGQLGQRLSSMTQGTVYVANGLCGPVKVNNVETGEFTADGGWVKYVNGEKISNPYVNDPLLSTPNQYGCNKLRFW